jgi:hypothetical protein
MQKIIDKKFLKLLTLSFLIIIELRFLRFRKGKGDTRVEDICLVTVKVLILSFRFDFWAFDEFVEVFMVFLGIHKVLIILSKIIKPKIIN